jgi:hypothetical protein
MTSAQRRARAVDGIYEEQLYGHTRARVRLPMTLLPVFMGHVIDELHAKRTGEKPSDPPLRRTRLDNALEGHEQLRWALSLYVCDALLLQESPSAGADGPRVPGSRVPFNEHQEDALARLAMVHKWLILNERRDLEMFAVMMGCIHPVYTPVSLAEFGSRHTLCRGRNAREEAAISRLLNLSETLSRIYQLTN